MLDDLEQMLHNGELGSLTVGELATHLGCSRRTLYELAPSKEALYLLVFDRMMHRLGRTALSRIDAEASAAEQLRQYTETSLGYTFESAAYEDLLDIPAIRRARERHHRFAASILERIIATGIGNGEFRPVDSLVAAHVILCSAVHLTTPDVVEDLGIPHDEAKRAMLDLLLDGLSAR